MQVYFYEAFEEEVAELKRCLPATVAAGFTWQTVQEAGHPEPPTKLISIRTQSVVPAPWFSKLDGLLARTTGYDHLVNLPVKCGHLPLYCHRAVAEQALLLWLALLRKLPEQMAHFATFNRDGLTGSECAGKNLLVVGVGYVGGEVVKIGAGLGMQVRRVDIIPERGDTRIEDGLPWADVIVCSMNLTPQNRGYFNEARLRQAKRGAVFVNVARGELSPTADLARLLDAGHLGGVGLDVYDNEKDLAVALRAGRGGFPLAGRPNVICTPHNAFNTHEAVVRKSEQSAQSVAQFLRTGRFPWPVNSVAA
jgi:D-lactate dehydrogenase